MASQTLMVITILLIPVSLGWKVAFGLLKKNPTPQVKLFFWVMSVLFVGLAAAAFVATRYIE